MEDQDIHTLPPGTQVSEYVIEKVLGEGGFGITYLAKDVNLNIHVAIKEYFPGGLAARDDTYAVRPYSGSRLQGYQMGLKSFIKEARVLARLRHSNIVSVRRYFEDNGTAYLVMEFIQGVTLHQKLEQIGVMTEEEVKAVFLPILDGLKQVHDLGILHRDIKPDNILISDHGQPVLIDFGAAKQETGEQTKKQSSFQTVADGYSPLEQYSASGRIGPWSDIYALSASAHYCLTMDKLSAATDRVLEDTTKPLTEYLPDAKEFSHGFLEVIDSGLSIAIDKRPLSVDAFVDRLDSRSVPVKKPPPKAKEKSEQEKKQDPKPEQPKAKPEPKQQQGTARQGNNQKPSAQGSNNGKSAGSDNPYQPPKNRPMGGNSGSPEIQPFPVGKVLAWVLGGGFGLFLLLVIVALIVNS